MVLRSLSHIFIFCLISGFVSSAYSQTAGEYHAEGWKFVENQEYQKAYEAFKKAAELLPDNAEYHRHTGWVLATHLKRYDEAFGWYEKTCIIEPLNRYVYFDIGMLNERQKDLHEAARNFEKGIEILKSKELAVDWWMYNNLAYYNFAQNPPSYEKALKYSHMLLELDNVPIDNRKNAIGWISTSYRNLGRHEEALSFFEGMIAEYPDNAEYHRQAGEILAGQFKRYDEALANFEQALAIEPDNQTICFSIGGTYGQMPDFNKAAEYYKRGVALAEEKNAGLQWWVFNNLAWYSIASTPPDYEDTIGFSKRLLEYTEVSREAKKNAIGWLATSYLGLRDFDMALEWAMKPEADTPSILEMLRPRTVEITGTLHVAEQIEKSGMSWVFKKDIVRIRIPIDTYYHRLVSYESDPEPIRIENVGKHRHAVYDFTKGTPDAIQIKVRVNLTPTDGYTLPPSRSGKAAREELAAYTSPTDFYVLDYPPMVKVIEEVTTLTQTEREKVEAIVNWISQNVTYMTLLPRFKDKEVTRADWPAFKDSTELFDEKWGHCGHFSQIAVAMLRSVNIPSRTVYGLYAGADGNVATHLTVEYYDSALSRWVYVEPQRFIAVGLSSGSHIIDTVEGEDDTASSLTALSENEWYEFGKWRWVEVDE